MRRNREEGIAIANEYLALLENGLNEIITANARAERQSQVSGAGFVVSAPMSTEDKEAAHARLEAVRNEHPALEELLNFLKGDGNGSPANGLGWLRQEYELNFSDMPVMAAFERRAQAALTPASDTAAAVSTSMDELVALHHEMTAIGLGASLEHILRDELRAAAHDPVRLALVLRILSNDPVATEASHDVAYRLDGVARDVAVEGLKERGETIKPIIEMTAQALTRVLPNMRGDLRENACKVFTARTMSDGTSIFDPVQAAWKKEALRLKTNADKAAGIKVVDPTERY